MDERKRESMVAYLRRRMAEISIEPEDVAASIAEDQRRQRAVRYRDAFGNGWDGEGAAPQWVVQATSAGQSLEHFAVDEAREQNVQRRQSIDWRYDPFAGTRLAKVNSDGLGAS
ncbi:H-NS family nucleoid-associated regulatory protein [Trinickia dinghuensis]|uniref:H-NS histone family protein n=1 Tax=Trinickia dinghuensis TaxID=2291023 RepID=A0A3D8K1B1_9BURK|nr:H-NS family nucleoid-associated regulatory protein [Trinickia dinghuensis]RDU99088.1 H-NS histone family protein [Trinickia dinghuensis]